MQVVKIIVIVPTRGRPQNAQRLAKAFAETVADPDNTHLVFGVDDDDPLADDYAALGVSYALGPRLRMAGTLNMIARESADDWDVIGFMGDDHLPRTYGWDNMVRENMKPGGVLYGNDLVQGQNLPTEVFLDARIVHEVGGFVPDGFTHLFLDNVWKMWGECAGTLRYLPDMIIQHVHPISGLVDYDEGYIEVNSVSVWNADEARFNEYVASGELDADVEKIKAIA
jgi:hypothetical protein